MQPETIQVHPRLSLQQLLSTHPLIETLPLMYNFKWSKTDVETTGKTKNATEGMFLSPSESLWFIFISFLTNLAFLTLYFSHILSEYSSTRSSHNAAFLLSLLGATVGTAFSLSVPVLPEVLPYMDIAIGLVCLTWVLLLHYYYGAAWLEAVFATAIASIVYVVILVVTYGLFTLWLGIS